MNVNNEVSGARPEEENIINIIAESELLETSEYRSIFQSFPKCNELYQWLMVSDAKTHPIAALTALLTIVSAVTARGYYSHTKASSTLFLIMIGKTGVGKNTVVKIPNAIMNALDSKHKILTGKIHSEGAMDDIFKFQNVAIQVVDEFGDFLGHMLNDKGGYFKAIAAKMKNLYSLTNGIYEPSRYSSTGGKNKTDDPWHTERPCFGITGVTTETQLLRYLNSDQISDGFLNRFIILNGQDVDPQFNHDPVYGIPKDILEHISSIKMATGYSDASVTGLNHFTNDEYRTIPCSEDAKRYYNTYIGDADIKNTDIYNFCLNDESEIKREISIRWRENALRMAVALSAYEKFDEVPLSVLEWCYNLVKQSSLNFLQLFEEKASQTQYEELKQKALTWFRSQNNKTQYHTLSELARNARPFSTMKSKERKELLDDLVESQYLQLKDENKTIFYRLV
jgi:energy-coupling factor transporter ATP-binding protein EcfA2